MVSPHFFVCSTALVLHSLQQMGFTLNGVPWGEKKRTSGTHFFWQSDYSVWAVKIKITALFYQMATAAFFLNS